MAKDTSSQLSSLRCRRARGTLTYISLLQYILELQQQAIVSLICGTYVKEMLTSAAHRPTLKRESQRRERTEPPASRLSRLSWETASAVVETQPGVRNVLVSDISRALREYAGAADQSPWICWNALEVLST